MNPFFYSLSVIKNTINGKNNSLSLEEISLGNNKRKIKMSMKLIKKENINNRI